MKYSSLEYNLLTKPNSAADLSKSHTDSDVTVDEPSDNEVSTDISADDIAYDGDDSPGTHRQKRKKRFTVANLSFTSSMMSLSSPPSPSTPKPAQVQNTNSSFNIACSLRHRWN